MPDDESEGQRGAIRACPIDPGDGGFSDVGGEAYFDTETLGKEAVGMKWV